MIDHSQARISQLALHRVGNRHREEDNFISKQTVVLTDEQEQLLLGYFLKPFTKCTEVYQFADAERNPICGLSAAILEDPKELLHHSVEMLMHLHGQSDHPHIKPGELFVAHITTLGFEERVVDAVGIFKAELLHPFLQFNENDGTLDIDFRMGTNAQRLDKGCLVMDLEGDESFRVLTVDANNYDAEYWKLNFLGLEQANDHHFQTRRHVELVKEFSKDVLAPNNRTEQIAFVNETVQFMNDRGAWDDDDFGLTVLRNADLKDAFNSYRQQFSDRTGVPLQDSFDISMPELEHQKRKYRNQISLDTKIEIKLPFSPDGTQPHIERGYDEARGMFYYKVFFNKEAN